MKRLGLVLLLTIYANIAWAFQVEPMVQNFEATGRAAQQTYRVENESSVELALEVVAYYRKLNEEGDEELIEDDDSFLILPPQRTIAPNSFQSFRVRYLGTKALTSTESYRIVFKQLPIDQPSEASEIKLLFNFSTLAFVSPEKTQAIPQVTVKDKKTIEIENLGLHVMDISLWKIKLTDTDNEPVEFGWDQLKALPISRFVMPMSSQDIDLTLLDDKVNLSSEVTIAEIR